MEITPESPEYYEGSSHPSMVIVKEIAPGVFKCRHVVNYKYINIYIILPRAFCENIKLLCTKWIYYILFNSYDFSKFYLYCSFT